MGPWRVECCRTVRSARGVFAGLQLTCCVAAPWRGDSGRWRLSAVQSVEVVRTDGIRPDRSTACLRAISNSSQGPVGVAWVLSTALRHSPNGQLSPQLSGRCTGQQRALQTTFSQPVRATTGDGMVGPCVDGVAENSRMDRGRSMWLSLPGLLWREAVEHRRCGSPSGGRKDTLQPPAAATLTSL